MLAHIEADTGRRTTTPSPTIKASPLTPPRPVNSRPGSSPKPTPGGGSGGPIRPWARERYPTVGRDLGRRLVARARYVSRGRFDATAIIEDPADAVRLFVLDGLIAVASTPAGPRSAG